MPEEVQIFTTLVSSVGFPIVAFYLMYKMVNGALKENTAEIKRNTELMSKLLAMADLLRQLKEHDLKGGADHGE